MFSNKKQSKPRRCCHPLAAAVVLLTIILLDPTKWSAKAFSRSSISSRSLSGRWLKTALSAERRPWNVIRFVLQSSRFVVNPFQSITTAGKTANNKRKMSNGELLWKAGNAIENDFTFASLDDVVMGGASASNFDQATGKWKGEVTDANNGGFIGIRSTPSLSTIVYDMSSCQGIQVKLTPRKNESLRLKVVLRDSSDFNGIGWTTSIDIDGNNNNNNNIKIPFNALVATRFAQTITGQTNFAKDQVCGVQLVFSKFEYDGALNPKFRLGDFSVQVEEIRTY